MECRAPEAQQAQAVRLRPVAPLQLEEAQALEAHWLPVAALLGEAQALEARRLPVAPLLGE